MQAREIRPFNEGWSFKRGPFPSDPVRYEDYMDKPWDIVDVPHTWNAADMQTKANSFYEGPAYYRKSLDYDESMSGKRVFIRFEGVGAVAKLYVNRQYVGIHKGAYSAFAFEIGNLLVEGSNEIFLIADNSSREDVIPVNHSLFGVYGGIYRPVQLIITDECNITVTDNASPGIYITQKNVSARSADICVKVKLDNGSLHPRSLTLENAIYDDGGKQIATHRQSLILSPQGTKEYSSDMKINRPHLWHGRKDPYLYKVVTRLISENEVIDEVVQPLGVRKIEIKAADGLYLNGEKYPMYGVTRHQDWEGLGSALTNKEHDFDLEQIMEIGATTVRFAHYQQSDYIYSKCDTLGLIVWAEIPFVNKVTGYEGDNARSQLRELIRQSFNHPSIYVWGLHNEVYRPNEYTASLTRELHDLAKTEDPDRYTVSVNGYGHADHPVNLNADIQGMNRYFGWYERKLQDIEPWVKGLEENYPWQILMLTEYGADANVEHQTEYLEDHLNWTHPFYPETFQTKTHEYHWSVIRDHPYIIASYLWNMFDFACPMWSRGGVEARNMKGMITFDRKIRKDSFYWYKANWSESPVLYLTQRRNTDRERKVTSITVYSNVGQPAVTLNGRELSGIRQGYTDVHYIIDDVMLDDGLNVIKAEVSKDGEVFTDTVEWNYSGEKQRGYQAKDNATIHSGW